MVTDILFGFCQGYLIKLLRFVVRLAWTAANGDIANGHIRGAHAGVLHKMITLVLPAIV